MSLPQAFIPFVEGAPCAVIARIALEYLVDDHALKVLFDDHTVAQYQRELTLTSLVQVMLDVSCGTYRSPRASFLARAEQIAASLSAFYGKLNRTEPGISAAVVAHSGRKACELIRALGGLNEEPIPSYRSFVLDGNALSGTDHRLKPLRNTRAAALPGKSLALYEYATGVVTAVVLGEDAYTQERALLHTLEIPRGIHLIADRNFCVTWFLLELQQAGSHFTVRHHRGSFPLRIVGEERYCGRCESGELTEQAIRVVDEAGQEHLWRKITLKLDKPTRDGETEIVLITNLPAWVSAAIIAMAYRQRWTIEQHFQRLTDWLHCEVPTLAHPRAALFAFAMSLVAANAFAILIAAFRAVQGQETANELSYCALTDEVGGTYRGMMLAVPPARWTFVRRRTVPELAELLRTIVVHANLRRLRKTHRGPKKPRRTPNCTNIRHVSTRRLLDRNKPC
jgi:hypothetical protein